MAVTAPAMLRKAMSDMEVTSQVKIHDMNSEVTGPELELKFLIHTETMETPSVVMVDQDNARLNQDMNAQEAQLTLLTFAKKSAWLKTA